MHASVGILPNNGPYAVAVTPLGGVVVARRAGEPVLWHCSARLGRWANRAQYAAACARAKAKLAAL